MKTYLHLMGQGKAREAFLHLQYVTRYELATQLKMSPTSRDDFVQRSDPYKVLSVNNALQYYHMATEALKNGIEGDCSL